MDTDRNDATKRELPRANQIVKTLLEQNNWVLAYFGFVSIIPKCRGRSHAIRLLEVLWHFSNLDEAIKRGGWLWETQRDLEDRCTGMTRNEQETARDILGRLGFIEEKKGPENMCMYRVN